MRPEPTQVFAQILAAFALVRLFRFRRRIGFLLILGVGDIVETAILIILDEAAIALSGRPLRHYRAPPRTRSASMRACFVLRAQASGVAQGAPDLSGSAPWSSSRRALPISPACAMSC